MPKDEEKSALATIEGLTPVSVEQLEDFRKAMEEQVIPEIEEIVERRRLLAAESRLQLKFWS
jgi:hypothetical protein